MRERKTAISSESDWQMRSGPCNDNKSFRNFSLAMTILRKSALARSATPNPASPHVHALLRGRPVLFSVFSLPQFLLTPPYGLCFFSEILRMLSASTRNFIHRRRRTPCIADSRAHRERSLVVRRSCVINCLSASILDSASTAAGYPVQAVRCIILSTPSVPRCCSRPALQRSANNASILCTNTLPTPLDILRDVDTVVVLSMRTHDVFLLCFFLFLPAPSNLHTRVVANSFHLIRHKLSAYLRIKGPIA
ncbi:hypothetical protein K474DRAFT_1015045 [Panus rudis PR-1116 ss-1]|nr:hypothetical protein K474DRAFT_1015045 [Panus rudis PR-1116 ss-1]